MKKLHLPLLFLLAELVLTIATKTGRPDFIKKGLVRKFLNSESQVKVKKTYQNIRVKKYKKVFCSE